MLTTRGSDNYYHFLTDVLPRIDLLEEAGVEVDSFVVNRSLPFQDELLARWGVSAQQTVESRVHRHVRAEQLVVPTLPDPEMGTPTWVVDALRARLLPDDLAPPHRRLYVGRGQTRNNRRVENEGELFSALEDQGFTKFDPAGLTVAEQVRTFAEASVIVAAHGAALTNVAFCSPATDVVELFAPDYVNPCYWALARRVPGVRYHYVVGRGREPRRNGSMLGVSSDIRMDVTKVLKTLDGIDA